MEIKEIFLHKLEFTAYKGKVQKKVLQHHLPFTIYDIMTHITPMWLMHNNLCQKLGHIYNI